MNCDFERAAVSEQKDKLTCRNCQHVSIVSSGVKLKRNCDTSPQQIKRHPLLCKHLGDEIGSTELSPCRPGCHQPKVARVFSCSLHALAVPVSFNRLKDKSLTDCFKCGKY